MSTACKCDRCAALFEHAVDTITVEAHVTTAVSANGDPTRTSYETDLCLPCSKELFEFLRLEKS